MTILETFIKLRDDLKLWVTNNLKMKANISHTHSEYANQNAFSSVWTANGSFSADSPSTTLGFIGKDGITVSAINNIGDLEVRISVDTDWLSSKIDEKIAAITNAEEVGF